MMLLVESDCFTIKFIYTRIKLERTNTKPVCSTNKSLNLIFFFIFPLTFRFICTSVLFNRTWNFPVQHTLVMINPLLLCNFLWNCNQLVKKTRPSSSSLQLFWISRKFSVYIKWTIFGLFAFKVSLRMRIALLTFFPLELSPLYFHTILSSCWVLSQKHLRFFILNV